MIRTTIACGAVTTLAGVAGLLIREYIVYKEHHTQIYLYYASPILIVSGVFILVAAVLNLTLAEPRVIIVQRPPVNHPDDVSEPSMTAPTSPIMPSPRSPIIRKVPLKPLDKKMLFSITDYQMEAYVKAHPQRVFDLDGITNRCEELLPGWDIANYAHDNRVTSRGLRFDPNHFRLHKTFWMKDKFDQSIMPPRTYN